MMELIRDTYRRGRGGSWISAVESCRSGSRSAEVAEICTRFGGFRVVLRGRGDRVLRGGSWFYDARYCQSAYRPADLPGVRDEDFGFRVVLRGRGSNERHERID